jgi:hypothetical protein
MDLHSGASVLPRLLTPSNLLPVLPLITDEVPGNDALTPPRVGGRGSHSSTFRLTLSALSGIGVHIGVI